MTDASPASSTSTIGGSILGNRVLRNEDPELLRGGRKYMADRPEGLPTDGLLYAAFVLSPVAHGLITAIHTEDAGAMPGVHAVWTAADLGLEPQSIFAKVDDAFLRPQLATDRVRFAGEAIAVVFADTFAQARDAAAAVWAEFEDLAVYTDPEAALATGAAPIFEGRGNNLARTESNDSPVDLQAKSDRVVRGRYVNQRMAVVPIEPHGCAAAPGDDGRLHVWVANQFPHYVQGALAEVLGMDKDEIHVTAPQVGGGFGGKAGNIVEYPVIAKAAHVLGRPVIWVPTRSDDMQAAAHSRGQVQYCELGLTNDGKFTGLRVHLVGDGGAYPDLGSWLSGGTRRMSPGTYVFDELEFNIAVAVTNTVPMGAYRGAGRPEATSLIERLVDQAALELGIDPIEIREKNLLGDEAFPYTTLTGNTYDTGRYALPLRVAAETIGYDELRTQQAERRARGDRFQLGIGVACYVEITSGNGGSEYGRVEVHPDGSATAYCGTFNHGQGHETAYAMLVSDQTGIPVERITLVDGDTDRVPQGGGTGGSRSLQLGGSAVQKATEIMVDKARELAASLLEANVADVVVDRTTGTIGVAGVPTSAMTWGALATKAAESDEGGLDGRAIFDQEDGTFPFGAHISLVEVDVETGQAQLLRHVAVDDAGTVLNPLLVEGQQHGGIGSGVGQALYEEILFSDGNPITGNLADYAIPSAAEMPSFEVVSTETPTPLNPLGVKGIGEAATVGSTPAVQNAVIDAVSHFGVRHIDMPCTPRRVWNAILEARAGEADPWQEPPAVFKTLPKSNIDADVAAAGAEAADGV